MNDPVAGCFWSAKIEHDGIVARGAKQAATAARLTHNAYTATFDA